MGKEAAQRHKDITLLLAAGGNHCLQAGIYPCPVVSAKATAYFLLDFSRAQVSFGLVVGERHTRHQRKGQNRVLVLRQTAQQITPWLPISCFSGVLCPSWVRVAVLPVPPGSESGDTVAVLV